MTDHPRRGPAHSSSEVTLGSVLMFCAEIAGYGAVAMAGWRVHWLAAFGAVLVMALWWGLLLSPKARWRLPRFTDLVARLAWFVVALVAGAWGLGWLG